MAVQFATTDTQSPVTTIFLRIDGQIVESNEQFEDITRPHVDGVAFRSTGIRGEPFVLHVRADVDDETAVESRRQTYIALQGRLGTLTDNLGKPHANLLWVKMLRFDPVPHRSGVGGLSANSKYMIEADIQLVDTTSN